MTRLPLIARAAAAAALAALLVCAPAVLAAEVTDIGFVDEAVLSALPAFQQASRQLNDYGGSLQKQYMAKARTASASQQQQLSQQFQAQMAAKQRELFGPLFGRAQVAIASVASSKSLSIVLDKRVVVFGGTDITGDVRELLNGVAPPVPPVNTPAPSSVGYVDQTQIDALPKVKSATADFNTFKANLDRATAAKMKAAKTDADRDAILKDYQSQLDTKQKQTLQPLVDRTRSAMSDVANKRGLALVIDRSNVIYGGTDITSDVTAELK